MKKRELQPTNNGYKTALIYCRVSTRNQQDTGTSLDTQAEACIKHAESLGYVIGRVTKEAYSGAELWDRPQLSRDRVDLRAGQFQALICYAIDRLSRDQAHLYILADECSRAGAQLLFVTEDLDNTPEGKLLQSVKAFVAEVERAKICERTMRGRKARVLSGKIHNAGSEFYGYRRDKEKGVREIYEPEAIIIRRIFHSYVNESMSLTAIARQLNQEGIPAPGCNRTFKDGRYPVWSKGTLRYFIGHEAYRGETKAWRYGTRKRGTHMSTYIRDEAENIKLPDSITPAIISAELWNNAQELMKTRANWKGAQKTRNESRPALLRGLIFCADCGRSLYYSAESKAKNRYQCQTNSGSSTGLRCNGRSTTVESADEWAWSQVVEFMQKPEVILRQVQEQINRGPDPTLIANLEACERQLQNIERGQQRLIKQMMTASEDLIEIIEHELKASDRRKQKFIAEMKELESRLSAQQINNENLKSIAAFCKQVKGRLDKFDFNSKRLLIEALGVEVRANGYEYDMKMQVDPEGNLTTDSGVMAHTSKSSQRPADRTAHQRPGWPTRWLLKANA